MVSIAGVAVAEAEGLSGEGGEAHVDGGNQLDAGDGDGERGATL